MDDSSGASLFGDDPAAGAAPYVVLARKYRPRTFDDLIGQEAMVRTIANSFALDRIPHAYILTGVRGVGKTTTARLLARALNYKRDGIDRPSIQLDPPGEFCAAIMESRHPDVFEMDAASRTGINDIREILDSVRYAPVMARTKVYIIDEVHMLSTAAFNGLLKTLEEPPAHVKFIFATTEIRKVPVTVLSRCQRFDLKRIAPERMVAHLAAICAKEGAEVEPDGLTLIARAAEGSARDALSLLDQAIVQKTESGGAVSAAEIRDMLGLADRLRVLDLFEAIAKGDSRTALLEVRSQYDSGADPALILRDLLEVNHEAARFQALGAETAASRGADRDGKIAALAARLSPAQLSMLWQMLLKALEEAARAPEPIAAAEMAMVRLCAAAGLPPPEEAARLLRERSEGAAPAASAAAAPPSGGPRLAKFEDVVSLIGERREIDLEIEVERHIRLVEFGWGRIVYAPVGDPPEDLPRRLMNFLQEETGDEWKIVVEPGAKGVESLAERRMREREAAMDEIRKHPYVAEALAAFPDAEIVDVRNPVEGQAEIVPLSQAQRRKPADPTAKRKPG